MMFYENDRRQHDRLYHHARVQITKESGERFTASTINLSDGGLLIKCASIPLPAIGDTLNVQTLEFPDAPIKKIIVRRLAEPDQIGAEFV